MKHLTHRCISAALLLLAVFIFSCSDSESRVPCSLQTAKVIINIGLPADSASSGDSIIDRMLRFFARDAVAMSAPASFDNILVRVTGPDIGPIEKNFSPYTSISFDVSAGNLRRFEVIATVAAGDPSAAASFQGTTSANCPAGATVSVPVVMGLYETKIVFPDYGYYQVGILNSINDSPSAITRITLSRPSMQFYPWDIDFDSRGRIYITNTAGSTDPSLFRMNNINSNFNDGTCLDFTTLAGYPLYGIAIDRKRDIIYVGTFTQVYVRDYNNNIIGSGSLTIPTAVAQIRGIAIDEASKKLYFACYYNDGGLNYYSIVKYDIDTQAVELPYYRLPSGVSWDVTVHGGRVYAAQYVAGSGSIIQLPLDLDTVTTPAVFLTSNPDATDSFIGPHRFVAISPRRLYVLDEEESDGTSSDEGIVSFTDISGAGWSAYQNSLNFFYFFSC